MIVAQDDELLVYIGLALSIPYDFKEDNDTPINFAGKSFTGILKNLHSEFENDAVVTDYGTISVEPDSVVGRLVLDLTATETNMIKVPTSELEAYTESEIYAKILIIDENSLPVLDIKVRPIKAY